MLETIKKAARLAASIDWGNKKYNERVRQEKGEDFPFLKGERVIAVADVHEEFQTPIQKGEVLTVSSYYLNDDTYSFEEIAPMHIPYLGEKNLKEQRYESRYFKKYEK